MYWMAITAFQEEADLYRMDLVRSGFTWPADSQELPHLFNHSHFPVWFVNTMLLSLCLVAITL